MPELQACLRVQGRCGGITGTGSASITSSFSNKEWTTQTHAIDQSNFLPHGSHGKNVTRALHVATFLFDLTGIAVIKGLIPVGAQLSERGSTLDSIAVSLFTNSETAAATPLRAMQNF